MKYLFVILFLFIPDSLVVKVKLDTVQQKEVHKQAQELNRGADSLSIKLDEIIELLKNDTTKKN